MSVPRGTSRVACVIGHPIGHSLSPAIHNAALRHEGRDAIYVAFDVTREAFGEAVQGMGALGIVGANVTIPHKQAAAALAGRRSEDAEATRAANTLLFEDGEVHAHNTDVPGIAGTLAELVPDVAGGRCLLLGAGGSARAALLALQRLGAAEILVSNRTSERAEELTDAARSGGAVAVVPWEGRSEVAGRADLIVNATAVGLEDDASPLDLGALQAAAAGGCRALLDLVYTPGETTLVRTARSAGLVSADGLPVLVRQAALAYERFWGAAPDIDVMREAARAVAGRPSTEAGGSRSPLV